MMAMVSAHSLHSLSRPARRAVQPLWHGAERAFHAVRALSESRDAAEYRRTLGRDALTAEHVKLLLKEGPLGPERPA